MPALRRAALLIPLLAATAFAAKPAPPPLGPHDPLPLEAQVNLDKGIDAAKAGDFKSALESFKAAWYKAPDSAVLFLNQGLAESRLPGRELRAIAWLSAYLAAHPAAPNKDAFQQTISELSKKDRANDVILKKSMVAAARVTGSTYYVGVAQLKLAQALVRINDLAGAEKVFAETEEGNNRNAVSLAVAEGRARAGNAAGARELVAAMTASSNTTGNYQETMLALCDVAGAQLKAGDKEGSRASMALAAWYPYKWSDAFSATGAWTTLAKAQMKAGDKEDARASLKKALEYAPKSDTLKEYLIAEVGALQAELGNLDDAHATFDMLDTDNESATVLTAIAVAQAKAGDFAAARKTADQTAPFMRCLALESLAEQQTKAGQPKEAMSTLADALKASENNKNALDRTFMETGVAFHQIHAGGFAQARETLERAKKTQKKIPWNKAAGFRGAGSNHQEGTDSIMSSYRELGWVEKPWTPWTYHLTNALDTAPFPDVAASLAGLKNSTSEPSTYLNLLSEATDKIAKERDLIDQMLAGGPPY